MAVPSAGYPALVVASAFCVVDPMNMKSALKPLASRKEASAAEAEAIASALRERKDPVQLVTLPDEAGSLALRANRATVYPAVVDFLDQNLKPVPNLDRAKFRCATTPLRNP